LLVLALLVDATMPSVGAFTVKLVTHVECDPAASVDVCAECSIEPEMEPARAERPFALPFAAAKFISERARLAEGHAPPPFRPPIAA
jgi:hypothetical protein